MPKKKLPKPEAGLEAYKATAYKRRIKRAITCFDHHKIKLTDDEKKAVSNKLRYWFIREINLSEGRPPLHVIKNNLKEIHARAKKFADALEGLDRWSVACLVNLGDKDKIDNPDSPLPREEREIIEFKKGMEEARIWQIITGGALKRLASERDPSKPNQAKRTLVFIIADICQQKGISLAMSRNSNTGEPQGLFFELMQDTFDSFDLEYQSEEALYTSIRRDLKYWKKATTPKEQTSPQMGT